MILFGFIVASFRIAPNRLPGQSSQGQFKAAFAQRLGERLPIGVDPIEVSRFGVLSAVVARLVKSGPLSADANAVSLFDVVIFAG
jgi:hypothetical protein